MKSILPKLTVSVFAIVFILPTVVCGQKITWGQTLTGTKDYNPVIIGEDATSFYTYSGSDNELILEKFEKAGSKRSYSKKYELPKNQNVEYAVLSDNKILIFISSYDKGKQLSEIYCNTYSPADGEKIEFKHAISSISLDQKERSTGKLYNGIRGVYENENYNFYTSSDNKRILMVHRWYTEKLEKYTTQYILLDPGLNKIVDKEEVISKDEESTFYISGMTIDQDGSYYVHRRYHRGGYRTVLISYDANKGYEKYEYKIDTSKLAFTENFKIDNSAITFNKNGEMILVGEFLKDNYYLEGCFFIKIDPKTKKMIEWKVSKFERKLMDQFMTQKQIKKGKDPIIYGNLNKMRLTLKEDGGVIGISDNHSRGNLPNSAGEFYLFKDIVVFNFAPNGTLLWANRIPRNQFYSFRTPFRMGKEIDYLSAFSALSNDKLYIAYNDKPENVAIKSDNEDLDRFEMSGKPVIALFTIDLKTGLKVKSQFMNGTDAQINLEPNSAFQKSQNSDPIILGSNNTVFKYGVMSFGK